MTTHENDLYAISERLSVTKMLNFAGPGRPPTKLSFPPAASACP